MKIIKRDGWFYEWGVFAGIIIGSVAAYLIYFWK